MMPIAQIFQNTDGTYTITSSVQSPLQLAHILALLLPNMIVQAAPKPADTAEEIGKKAAIVLGEPEATADGDAHPEA